MLLGLFAMLGFTKLFAINSSTRKNLLRPQWILLVVRNSYRLSDPPILFADSIVDARTTSCYKHSSYNIVNIETEMYNNILCIKFYSHINIYLFIQGTLLNIIFVNNIIMSSVACMIGTAGIIIVIYFSILC